MIGMSQIRKRLIYGILIGAGIGIVGIAITLIWSMSVVNSYKEGTNKDYIANYTTEIVTLNRDVIQGETITDDMLTKARVHKNSAPNNQAGDSVVGMIAKYNIPANIPLVDSMFGTEVVRIDERIQEVTSINLPTGIEEGEYMDIKIKMASGLEYVVIPQVEVRKRIGNTIHLYLDEEDLYYLNSAIVDVYLSNGAATLYGVKYVDPATQIKIGDVTIDKDGNEVRISDLAKRDLVEKIQKDVANGTVALTIPSEVVTEKVEDTDKKEDVKEESKENSKKEEPTPEYINFTNNLTDLLLKYAIEYRYYIESYNMVGRTYQPSDLIRRHMEKNEYIAEEAKAKLNADIRRQIEENISEFMAVSGEDGYELAVSGLKEQISAQQATRSSVLNGQQ